MKIELNEISVKKLTAGFADNAEQGVVAYGGRSTLIRNCVTRCSEAVGL
jgi:hypothetical protein